MMHCDLERNKIDVHHLTDWEDVCNEMCNMNKFEATILSEIRKIFRRPYSWSNLKAIQ